MADYYLKADGQRTAMSLVTYRISGSSKWPTHPSAKVSLEAAQQKAQAVTKQLQQMKFANTTDLVEQTISEALTLRYGQPAGAAMREIRRRTRVVGAFPDGQSALMLCTARLCHITGTKRYLSIGALHKQDLEDQVTA